MRHTEMSWFVYSASYLILIAAASPTCDSVNDVTCWSSSNNQDIVIHRVSLNSAGESPSQMAVSVFE
jgi:hypothetical protein